METERLLSRKSQIIEAAVIVFGRKGFHRARMEEIALEAGVGKGTVYEYFQGKYHLFQEMLQHVNESYLEQLQREAEQKVSVRRRLIRIFEVHLAFFQNHKEMARLQLSEFPLLGEQLRSWMLQREERKVRLLSEVIKEGTVRGEFREVDSLLAARVAAGAMIYAGYQLALEDREVNSRELALQMVGVILEGLHKS